MSPSSSAPVLASTIADRARDWWESLDSGQQAQVLSPFDSADAREFTYLPGPRAGLSLADMGEHQQVLAMRVLEAGLSGTGADTARAVMALEQTLRDLEHAHDKAGWDGRHPHYYWFRLLGLPDAVEPWAFHVGGHHVCLHFTVVGDHVAGTPQFFGANPAIVPAGPQAGVQTLPQEEHLARHLLASFDPAQQDKAIVSPHAPLDIATRRDPVADIGVVPRGLRYEHLDTLQRGEFEQLIKHYLDRLHPDLSGTAWRALVDEGLSEVTFAWLGSSTPGAPHYYAITGQSFLLEYDCVQDGANHVHTVWRDVRSDWGIDVLARHHAAGRH